jgi:hypothetical protein
MINFNIRDEVIYKHHKGIVSFVDESYIVIKGQSVRGRDYPLLVVFPEYYQDVILIREHKSDYGN